MKQCKGCKQIKPTDQYHPHKLTRDKLRGKCKVCFNADGLSWQRRNPGRVTTKMARYRAKLRQSKPSTTDDQK